MAEKKATVSTSQNTETVVQNKNVEDTMPSTAMIESHLAVMNENLNLDAKVTVKNLAGWDITFRRLQDGEGDVLIVADGQTRLSRNEIIAQINDNNILFVGIDGVGSHATIYIDDAATRKWVGFETHEHAQNIFTEKLAKKLFDMKQSEYENAVKENVRTRAEKYALIKAIKKIGLNDYAKIMFAQKYTGFSID